MSKKHQLGQLLISKKLVAPAELAKALAEQQESGGRLGAILVRRGAVSEDGLVRALAGQLHIPVARIGGKTVNSEILSLVSAQLAEKYRCLPLFRRRDDAGPVLFLAMENPADHSSIDELSFQLGERLQPVLIGPAELEDALQRHYHPDPVASAGSLPPLSMPPSPSQPEETDTETAPELPPPDPLLHPTPASGQDTAPDLGALGASAGAVADSSPIPAPAVEPALILRALSQLLVEKGVIRRDELVERVRCLTTTSSESGGRLPAPPGPSRDCDDLEPAAGSG
jgi:hypothetical protein